MTYEIVALMYHLEMCLTSGLLDKSRHQRWILLKSMGYIALPLFKGTSIDK